MGDKIEEVLLTASQIVTAILIHLVVPAAGVAVYAWLCYKMLKAKVDKPPYFPLFFLFASFGAWLVLVLTVLFWKWSGMASIGVMWLITVAPIVTAIQAGLLNKMRSISKYHSSAFHLSRLYSGLIVLLVFVWLTIYFFELVPMRLGGGDH